MKRTLRALAVAGDRIAGGVGVHETALASPEARQAMNYLFPYDEFLSTVMKDTLERGNGPFPDLLFSHDPNVFLYPTDIEKAKQLLRPPRLAAPASPEKLRLSSPDDVSRKPCDCM